MTMPPCPLSASNRLIAMHHSVLHLTPRPRPRARRLVGRTNPVHSPQWSLRLVRLPQVPIVASGRLPQPRPQVGQRRDQTLGRPIIPLQPLQLLQPLQPRVVVNLPRDLRIRLLSCLLCSRTTSRTQTQRASRSFLLPWASSTRRTSASWPGCTGGTTGSARCETRAK